MEMNYSWKIDQMETSVLQSAAGRPLGRPRCRWEGNIQDDIKYIWKVWIGLLWLRIESRDPLF
jgi:hypothetical protein